MTVATSNSRDAYNCSGGTTYDFHFGVGATSEVKVVLTDASGVETTLTETTHYTVSATNSDYSSGGTVTTVSAYAAPNKITIVSNVPLTQESDFTEGMPTLYETFESGLDKLTRIVQQHNEIIVRSLTLPLSSASISALLPVPVANAYLAINSAGTAFEMRSLVAQGSISDEAYDAATWLSATTVAPSKKAVRDILETKASNDFATAAEITAGLESAKAIAPDQLKLSSPTVVALTASAGNITATHGDIVIGTAGHGIDFSADSGAAGMTSELLDDYEEGTWTPTWNPASGSGQTISVAVGSYTKIGNRVFLNCSIGTNGHGTASGEISIGGLPFTSSSVSNEYSSVVCGQGANMALTAGQGCVGLVASANTIFYPQVWNATSGTSAMTAAEFGIQGVLRFSVVYNV